MVRVRSKEKNSTSKNAEEMMEDDATTISAYEYHKKSTLGQDEQLMEKNGSIHRRKRRDNDGSMRRNALVRGESRVKKKEVVKKKTKKKDGSDINGSMDDPIKILSVPVEERFNLFAGLNPRHDKTGTMEREKKTKKKKRKTMVDPLPLTTLTQQDPSSRQSGCLHLECGGCMDDVVDFLSFPFSGDDDGDDDSMKNAVRAFQWIIAPMDKDRFFREMFQKRAMVISRTDPGYFSDLFNTRQLIELLQQNELEYGTNINVAQYRDGIRYTLNGSGRVYARTIQQHLTNGCSIQLVNPQTFSIRVWYLCEILQELFGSFVGANTYLTPAGSAGFAPHWDDVDAFLLQLEGSKHWKLYAPEGVDDALPAESSGNFSDADMKNRRPVFDDWVHPGDLIYIPRGFIHQAHTGDDVHSLHITISFCRRVAIADLMERFLPETISAIANENIEMRHSLPIGYLDMAGIADVEYLLEEKTDGLKSQLNKTMEKMMEYAKDRLDSAIDLMAREFMRTALPPLLTPEERRLSAVGDDNLDILQAISQPLGKHIRVRFIRRHTQRLLYESDDRCFVVHRMNNSRVYEGKGEQLFDLPIEHSAAFLQLANAYPQWTTIGDLPGPSPIKLCQLLFDHGLLLVTK